MPHIIEINDLSDPALDVFARLTQAQLRSRLEPEKGVFIAESPKVIARALDAGLLPPFPADGTAEDRGSGPGDPGPLPG